MVKLQLYIMFDLHCLFMKFPLWHGKVATPGFLKAFGSKRNCFRFGMVKLQPRSPAAKMCYSVKFPLWHGKVATNGKALIAGRSDLFPLWHGKVATPPVPEPSFPRAPGFRFGMVKLQLALTAA